MATDQRDADGALVRFHDVTKTYQTQHDKVPALGKINVAIKPGEFVSILGPSGCGKSTLLMIAAGLVPASSGDVQIDGKRVAGPVTDVGIAFQRDLLFDWRTIIANVMLQAEVRNLDRREAHKKAMRLLAQVGLAGFEHRHPWELSGGMRQRVALCRALLHDSPLLLLDEPFGALDALTRDQMNLDLQRLWWSERRTALLITHSISEAIFLSDRVLVMSPRPGRIIADMQISLDRPRVLEQRDSAEFVDCQRSIRTTLEDMGIIKETLVKSEAA